MIYTRLTKLALRLCFDGHRDQVDKTGLPYVFHPFHLAEGMKDEATGIRGWMFPVGSTGMASLGDGYFYFSHNYNSEQGQGSTIRMYRYSGRPDAAFEVVK